MKEKGQDLPLPARLVPGTKAGMSLTLGAAAPAKENLLQGTVGHSTSLKAGPQQYHGLMGTAPGAWCPP